MFNQSRFENSRAAGVGVLEVLEAEDTKQGAGPRFVPLKRTDVIGEVVGPLAAVRLVETYSYTREQCPLVLEAAYRFPLPGDAAVTGLTVRFGEVEIRAELRLREQAEAEYDQARKEGRQATLLTRESPDVFTVRIAGLQPGQDVVVETRYVQLARTDGPGWSLRIPLTTAPRYVRSDEVASAPAQGQPLAAFRDPGHRFALDIAFTGAGQVESPTHGLEVKRETDGLRARLRGGEEIPDRDCVLQWRAENEATRPLMKLFAQSDDSDRTYFLALVAPPTTTLPRGVQREVVVLVDHSGSMRGAKWAAADWTVEKFLSDLGDCDAFGLGLFHNETRWFSGRLAPAERQTVSKAVRFLKEHRDSGGTELGVALEQALSLPRAEDERARHVLVITDAQVSDAGRILRLAQEEGLRTDARRVSVICIDAAPNSFLALQLAERTGGVARFLTSAPDAEDISTALDEILADWAQPVYANLRLELNRPQALAAGRRIVTAGAEATAIDLGDLPAGRAVWVAGSVPGRVQGLEARVQAGSAELGAAAAVPPVGDGRSGAIKALFGAWRVLGLEMLSTSGYPLEELGSQLVRLGYDPTVIAIPAKGQSQKVYAENQRADAEKALSTLLGQEALAYGLASSRTAFVGVRSERGRVLEGTAVIGNALPLGWSEDFTTGLAAPAMPAVSPSMHSRGWRSVRTALHAHRLPSMALAEEQQPSEPPAVVVFSGSPALQRGEAVLLDTRDTDPLPKEVTLTRLRLRFLGAVPSAPIDSGLAILIFVDDPALPRARVRLADLVRLGGERPLNLRRGAGQRVRVVLMDPAGAWAAGAPAIEVSLG